MRTKSQEQRRQVWQPEARRAIESKHIRFSYPESTSEAVDNPQPIVTIERSRLGPHIRVKRPMQHHQVSHGTSSSAVLNQLQKRRLRRAGDVEKQYVAAPSVQPETPGTVHRLRNARVLAFKHLSRASRSRKPRLARRSMKPSSYLEKLPAEILVLISTHLEPYSKVLLATASRMLRSKLGLQDVASLSNRQWKNLVRIWDDHSLHTSYCLDCNKLHSPFISIEPHDGELSRRKGSYPCRTGHIHNYTKFHQRLQYGIVHTIMKWHTKGLDCTPLLQQVQQTETTQCAFNSSIHIQTSEKVRIIRGHLVVHSQTVINLAKGTWVGEDPSNIEDLLSIINSLVSPICRHCKWRKEIRKALMPCTRDKMQQRGQNEIIGGDILPYDDVEADLGCLLTHSDNSTTHCPGYCVHLEKPGKPRSCDSCYTDYAFNAATVDGLQNRVLVLSTWQVFGEGLSRADHKWWTFMYNEYTYRRSFTDIFRIYEEVDDPLFKKAYGGYDHVYRPRIKPLDLVRLKEFGDRIRYESPDCGRPHIPGRDGIIMYPDPYEC